MPRDMLKERVEVCERAKDAKVLWKKCTEESQSLGNVIHTTFWEKSLECPQNYVWASSQLKQVREGQDRDMEFSLSQLKRVDGQSLSPLPLCIQHSALTRSNNMFNNCPPSPLESPRGL